MSEPNVFEARLVAALDRYAERAPTHVEPVGFTRAIALEAGAGRSRRWASQAWFGGRLGARSMAFVLVALLLAAAISVLAGSWLIRRFVAPPLPAAVLGFQPTGSMATARWRASAFLEPDGRILVASPGDPIEMYDPATGTFSRLGARQYAGTSFIQLLDGQILSLGNGFGLDASEIDPRTGTEKQVASFGVTPTGPLASWITLQGVRLADGRVLVIGGYAPDSVGPAHLFDPSTGLVSETATPADQNVRSFTLLPDGRVLLIEARSVELYDPATGRFVATGAIPGMSTTTVGVLTATVLADGRVLVVGTTGEADGVPAAWLYDPPTGAFRAIAAPGVAHDVAVRLTDGRVLVAGGSGPADAGLDAAELYDPAREAFSATKPMVVGRSHAAATLLTDGRVLIAGGMDPTNSFAASAELFDPFHAVDAGR